jgi:hypothetical protein
MSWIRIEIFAWIRIVIRIKYMHILELVLGPLPARHLPNKA